MQLVDLKSIFYSYFCSTAICFTLQVERLEILKCLIRLGGVCLATDVDESFLEGLSKSAEQFSGANLKGLLYSAQLLSLKRNELQGIDDEDQVLEVSREDLEGALRDTRPSLIGDKISSQFSGKQMTSRSLQQQRVTLA